MRAGLNSLSTQTALKRYGFHIEWAVENDKICFSIHPKLKGIGPGFMIFCIVAAVVVGSPCSRENRTTQLTTCLTDIGAALLNPGIFWFGSAYHQRCPPNLRYTLECVNLRPNATDSVMSRLYGANKGFDVQVMDRLLDVHFTSGDRKFR